MPQMVERAELSFELTPAQINEALNNASPTPANTFSLRDHASILRTARVISESTRREDRDSLLKRLAEK